ncbi:MAG TPA: cytochrome c biogenesis heme-transporting ATPase CcmA [Steroidobacteraceae bacterium]|jgi:heme exporter protein A|nr:cytochrome c biogenesis heme-transporting ATPase CcmA [Steroidobacteraceae bacterium]
MNELTADNLHLWRGEQHVLQGVEFSVRPGQCLQVMGANGAGKTTLLRALCGLAPLEEGRVSWCGRDISVDPESYHLQLSWLGHDHGLKGDLTAAENLRYAVSVRRRVRPDEIAAALVTVGVPDLAGQRVRQMSAGQRRRVALARMTLMGGALWIMDEPGSNLDLLGQELVSALLRTFLDRGGIAVVATHQALDLPSAQLRPLTLQ